MHMIYNNEHLHDDYQFFLNVRDSPWDFSQKLSVFRYINGLKM